MPSGWERIKCGVAASQLVKTKHVCMYVYVDIPPLVHTPRRLRMRGWGGMWERVARSAFRHGMCDLASTAGRTRKRVKQECTGCREI